MNTLRDKSKKKVPFKGQLKREWYQMGYNEASKAFGGCKECYGKGYATTKAQAGNPRYGYWELLPYLPCNCDRGKQIENLMVYMLKAGQKELAQEVQKIITTKRKTKVSEVISLIKQRME